jgi:twinkle protein
VLITEGEVDAMSAYDMLRKYKVACISLPQGANVKALADNLKYLGNFKEVYACMDQDEPGKKVEKEIASLVPHCKFMCISEKDPNDMLVKGKEVEFVSAFWDAKVWKPESIVRVSDVLKDVLKKPVYGVPWPWPTLTKATYGRNPGQGMYVGAGVKIGKSEFINELIAFDVKDKRSIAVLKYEEPPVMTVKRVSGKLDGIAYHRPGVTYLDAQLEATAQSMDPYLYMYPAFGRATWESTREYIRYCAVMGCTTIIIDPITKLTNHLNSSDTETELRLISDELACMAMDLGFFYIVTCHLKAPINGQPHERGGKVQSAQFRGSRAMMENCFYLLGIERNKDPSLPEDERNTSTFVLLEDRNFGNTVQFPVVYNPLTQAYSEPTSIF